MRIEDWLGRFASRQRIPKFWVNLGLIRTKTGKEMIGEYKSKTNKQSQYEVQNYHHPRYFTDKEVDNPQAAKKKDSLLDKYFQQYRTKDISSGTTETNFERVENAVSIYWRFVEDVYVIDVDEVEDQMLRKAIIQKFMAFNGPYTVTKSGFHFIVKILQMPIHARQGDVFQEFKGDLIGRPTYVPWNAPTIAETVSKTVDGKKKKVKTGNMITNTKASICAWENVRRFVFNLDVDIPSFEFEEIKDWFNDKYHQTLNAEISKYKNKSAASSSKPKKLSRVDSIGSDQSTASSSVPVSLRRPRKKEDVEGLLLCMSADCHYDDWVEVGMACAGFDARSEADGTEIWGFDVWDAWAKTVKDKSRYGGRDTMETKYQSFTPNGTVVGWKHLKEMLKKADPDKFAAWSGEDPTGTKEMIMNAECIAVKQLLRFIGKYKGWSITKENDTDIITDYEKTKSSITSFVFNKDNGYWECQGQSMNN